MFNFVDDTIIKLIQISHLINLLKSLKKHIVVIHLLLELFLFIR